MEGTAQPALGLRFLKSLRLHMVEKHTSKNVRGHSEVQLFTCMHYFYVYVSIAVNYSIEFFSYFFFLYFAYIFTCLVNMAS